MKGFLKFVRNIFLLFLVAMYLIAFVFGFIVTLNKEDNDIIRIGKTSLVTYKSEIYNDGNYKYDTGMLLVLKKQNSYNEKDEVFSIRDGKLIISTVEKTLNDTSYLNSYNSFVENDKILGTRVRAFNVLGNVLNFFISNIVFILIINIFVILLLILFLIIYTMKKSSKMKVGNSNGK